MLRGAGASLFSAAIALSMVLVACARPSFDSDKDAEPRRDSESVDTADPPADDTEESDPRDCWGPPDRDTGPLPWDTGGAGDTDTGPAPVAAEPTHAASDLVITEFDEAFVGALAKHGNHVVVARNTNLYILDYREGSVEASLTVKEYERAMHGGSPSADVDGDGFVDVLTGASDAAWVIWGPVSGSMTPESGDVLQVPETDESGSMYYATFGVVTAGSSVVQWGVRASGTSGYVDGRVYLFEGGSRASSPLDIADAEAQILPAHGDDVEDVFNAGDFGERSARVDVEPRRVEIDGLRIGLGRRVAFAPWT